MLKNLRKYILYILLIGLALTLLGFFFARDFIYDRITSSLETVLAVNSEDAYAKWDDTNIEGLTVVLDNVYFHDKRNAREYTATKLKFTPHISRKFDIEATNLEVVDKRGRKASFDNFVLKNGKIRKNGKEFTFDTGFFDQFNF